MMRRSPCLLLSAALAGLAIGPAQGQDAVSALKGHNSKAPVDVAADRIELQDRADRAVMSGNVEMRQQDMTLKAPRVTIAYSRTGGTEIQRLDASGGVTVTSPSETARGQYAIYDFDRKLITMLGSVTLTRAGSNVSGNRLVIDLNSGHAIVDGSAAGSAASGSGGRVTGHFTVPDRNP
jgi:lipopolysaccharide export system protein LptA